MYIILLPNRLWYTADTWQEVKDFLKIVSASDINTFHDTKILKCTGPKQWEEIELKENE